MKKIAISFFLSFFVLAGFTFSSAQSPAAKKAVFIIAAKDFQDDEFAVPKAVLEKNGVQVTVASTTLSEITGMNGAKTKADILLKDVVAKDYDAVVFIGGSGAQQYLDDPLAHTIAQESVAQGKITAAICIAPVILTNAGLLKGKNATCYPTEGKSLTACGVNYSAKPVEIDGNIITADGPGSAQRFGEEIIKALSAGRIGNEVVNE
jgi:protease I